MKKRTQEHNAAAESEPVFVCINGPSISLSVRRTPELDCFLYTLGENGTLTVEEDEVGDDYITVEWLPRCDDKDELGLSEAVERLVD